MARLATKTKTTKATKKVASRRAPTKSLAATRRPHFAIRAIRNANPRSHRAHRAGSLLARIFSF